MSNKEELIKMVNDLRERYKDLHDTRGTILQGFDDIEDFIASNF